MRGVKLFVDNLELGKQHDELEGRINKWLAECRLDVSKVLLAINGRHGTVCASLTFPYDDWAVGNRNPRLKLFSGSENWHTIQKQINDLLIRRINVVDMSVAQCGIKHSYFVAALLYKDQSR